MTSTSETSEQLVTLNVGNKINYTTHKSILMNSSFFKSMFDFKMDLSKPIFIDCEPHAFKHILEYLRYGNYQIPSRYKYLATFFGIDEGAFEDIVTKPMIIMWKGKMIRVNKQKDIYLTIEDALRLLVNVSEQKTYKEDTVKSTNAFKLMRKLMKHATIISLCLDDLKKFINRTLTLIQKTYESIVNEQNEPRFRICDIFVNKIDSANYNKKFKLYIQYDGIYALSIRNLFKDLQSKGMTEDHKAYINYFVKCIQENPSYEEVKDKIVHYKALK